MAYVPASRLQLDQRPQLYVTSRTQLQPLQQRITLSIIGIYYVNILFIYNESKSRKFTLGICGVAPERWAVKQVPSACMCSAQFFSLNVRFFLNISFLLFRWWFPALILALELGVLEVLHTVLYKFTTYLLWFYEEPVVGTKVDVWRVISWPHILLSICRTSEKIENGNYRQTNW